MPNLPRRHFLPWDRPLLPQAVAFLAGDWKGPEPLDLSGTLVVVPTRQSGRRIREALAAHAAGCHSAVFPPRVLTPEALVASAETTGTATRLQSVLAWIDVLRGIVLEDYREVFPVDPPTRNFGWALRLAEQLHRLQTTLGDNDLRIADVATRGGENFPEAGRWQQLAALERRQEERLSAAGLRSSVAARAEGNSRQPLGTEIQRVVLLATVDPLPAAISLLAGQADAVAIDVVVFAPESEADAFDAWGRTITRAWTDRTLVLAEFKNRVHLCADPGDEAIRVAALAVKYQRGPTVGSPGASPEGALGVGLADPDVLPLLEGEATRAGVAVFNPEGRRRRDGSLYHLLTALADGAGNPMFEAVERLARCPDFLEYLERQEPEFSSARFLDGLDDLRREHLPADLNAARHHASTAVAPALARMAEICGRLQAAHFPDNIAEVLGRLFGGRRFDVRSEEGERLEDAATAWTTALRECVEAAKHFTALAANEWWELALRWFGESRRTEEKPAGALELQGWLELLYEDAPHLVVAGLNDGFVPEAVGEDAFLPESLRLRLGLKTNAARFARDAYLLQAMAAARTRDGRLDLLLAKASTAGDPLRPSRLLLRCADSELPERVAFLFRTPEPADSHLPWRRAWRLKPRRVPAPARVAVTSLRRWLVCPFRFYLKYALRMEAVDAAKTEMDAFDFGTLCHAAVEAMGREPAMRDCTDAAVLRDFLLRELERDVHAKFGTELSLPLLIQAESARQRLGKVAELQARERAAGWVIEVVERPFAVEIAGLTVSGKIDRIDRNVQTGAIRVVDYKTSDTAVNPRAAHVRPVRSGESLPEWATVTLDGRLRAWADLQLPLYRHALAPEWGEAIACGYINLPKAVGQTALALWDDYTPELHTSAMRCAEGVCGAIRQAEFWPPNENIRADSDEFAALFQHGVSASVEGGPGS